MTWGKQAADSLAETLGSWFTSDGVAAAAAAVDASGTFIAASPPDLPADGRFEIGSVTKTMTATVLASLAADGALGLDDPIGRWLSAGQHSQITIRQLATHTSGLSAVAPNRQATQDNPANPWVGYTFERAEEGLRQATVTPGNPWRYSNLGYQLLGLILQRASGTDYPALMTSRLLAPLAMTHSGVGRHGEGALLPGHAADRQAPRWEHPWGAGGVEATITDLACYANAGLLPPATPLGTAIRLAQTPLLPREDGSRQALGWVVEDGTVCWHTGGTGGFSSCVMIDHGQGRAVAALLSYGGSPRLAPQAGGTAGPGGRRSPPGRRTRTVANLARGRPRRRPRPAHRGHRQSARPPGPATPRESHRRATRTCLEQDYAAPRPASRHHDRPPRDRRLRRRRRPHRHHHPRRLPPTANGDRAHRRTRRVLPRASLTHPSPRPGGCVGA
jgi:CubicO group peptidase (beta-lactamase class C family)